MSRDSKAILRFNDKGKGAVFAKLESGESENFNFQQNALPDVISKYALKVSGWRTAGRTLGMTNRDLEDFADAFEHPERTAAKKHLA